MHPVPETPSPIPRVLADGPDMTRPVTHDDLFRRLFEEHYRELVRLVSGLLDDNETCEEVVQDAFAAMLRSGRPPRPGSEPAYLRSAAMNGARSQLRKRRVRRRHIHSVPEPFDDAATSAIDRVENQHILEVVRGLPRRQSEVLLLRFHADLSEIEIAKTLDISPGSVKTHASRGLAAVRRRLEELS